MLRNNYDVAMLMQKKQVCSGFNIFVPIQSIVGHYNQEEAIFYTTDGTNYCILDSYINSIDLEEEFFCDSIILKNDFNTQFGNYNNLKKALVYYRNQHSRFRVLKYDPKTEKNKTYLLDIDEFFVEEKSSNQTDLRDEIISDDTSLLTHSPETDDVIDISAETQNQQFEFLQKLIKGNTLSKEELKKFYDCFLVICDNYNILLEDVSNIIGETVPPRKVKVDSCQPKTSQKKCQNIYKSLPKKEFYEMRKQIIKEIKNAIIGQDECIDQLVVELFRLGRNNNEGKNKGIILTGSTGVGKSRICTLLAEYLNVPCKVIDTTQLSMPGYKGENIETYLKQLYYDENKDLDKIEHSIIIFDEVDKKGSSRNDDVSGRGVLNQLLKFLDGTEYTIRLNENESETVRISTKNMTTIFAGAFSNVYKNPKFTKNNLGFKENISTICHEPSPQDFIELGGFPDESMGRLPVIIHLNTLEEQNLIDILLKSTESDLLLAQHEFKQEADVQLEFTDEAIAAIAHKAYGLKTGARALQTIIHECTYEAFRKVTDELGRYSKVIITEKTIDDNNNYQLLSKNKEKILQK